MIGSFIAFMTRCLGVLAGSFVVVFAFQFIRWALEPLRRRWRQPQKGDLWKDIDGRMIVVLDRNGDELNLCRYVMDPEIGRVLGCWREDLTTFKDRVQSHQRRFYEKLESEDLLAQWVAANKGRLPDLFEPQDSPSPGRQE